MKIKTEDVKKAICKQFQENPESIKTLGKKDRPNSWTFYAYFKNDVKSVIKMLKPAHGEEIILQSEEEALKRIRRRGNVNVAQYTRKGKLSVKRTELLYFIFPYVDGSDLETLISQQQFSEEEALKILNDLTEIILQLAEENIIHQDIKPANILLKKSSRDVFLLDFGIARFIEYDHRLVKQQGPARYLSSEQVKLGLERIPRNQRKITFLSDIYSASVVVLHMLLGKDFYSKWKPDQRSVIVQQLEKGELVDIRNTELKKRLVLGLQESLSNRLRVLKFVDQSKLKFLLDRKPGLSMYWNLHYSTTGTKLLTQFPQENIDIKGGVLFQSEHMKSLENNIKSMRELHKLGWKFAIDPSTYKLPFLAEYLAKLKERDYYRQSVNPSFFYNPEFSKKFVFDVMMFQKQFNPDFYISPYFYIKDLDDPYLDITFNLFEEAKRQVIKFGSNSQLLFGLSLSKDIILNNQKIDQLVDQFILYPQTDSYYLRIELTKNNNKPCSDENYLSGLLRLIKKLTYFKSLLLSQSDQSTLGLLANTKLSVAINPDASIRKQDIQNKLSKKPVSGGPNKADIRTWYYVPTLLNDLDLKRDIQRNTFQTSGISEKLQCNCKYCSQDKKSIIDIRGDNYHRWAHFMLNFYNQMDSIRISSDRKKAFKVLIEQAKEAYSMIDKANIKLDSENNGKFLDVWERVFLGAK